MPDLCLVLCSSRHHDHSAGLNEDNHSSFTRSSWALLLAPRGRRRAVWSKILAPFLTEKPLASRLHLANRHMFYPPGTILRCHSFCHLSKISQDLVSLYGDILLWRSSWEYSILQPVYYEQGSSFLQGFFTLPFGKAFSLSILFEDGHPLFYWNFQRPYGRVLYSRPTFFEKL